MRQLILAFLLGLAATSAFAVEPSEVLSDPALEARARGLSQGLRCLVCQNQSIDDSNASLAKDLRLLVRERLLAGDSDQAVLDYIVARYGDFVLLRPPVKPTTYLLWFSPLAIFLIALAGLGLYFRRARQRTETKAVDPLTEQEQASLDRILEEARDR